MRSGWEDVCEGFEEEALDGLVFGEDAAGRGGWNDIGG